MKNLLFFLTFSSALCFGQGTEKIDSLHTVLQKTNLPDTVKINTYKGLIYQYMYVDQDSSLAYSKKLFDFSREKKSDFGLYQAYYSKAFYFFSTSTIDSVISNLKIANNYAKKLENSKLETEIHLKLCGVYNKLSQREKAIRHADTAITISKNNNNWQQLGYAYIELGNVFFYSNEYDKAIKNYQLVDSVFTSNKFKGIGHGSALSNIGLIYLDMEQPKKAKVYFNRCKKVYEDINYSHGIYMVNTRLGQVAYDEEDYKTAIPLLKSSANYYKSINDRFKEAETNYLLGQAYMANKNMQLGLEKLNNALSLRKDIQDSLGVLETQVVLSQAYHNLKNYPKSIELAKTSIEISKKLNELKEREQAYLFLAQSNFQINKHKEAYNSLHTYTSINDSLERLKNTTNLQELEKKYQTTKKEQEIALLTSQGKVTKEQRKNERNLFLGGLILLLVAGLFFFFQYRNRQKTNRKLKELDTAKSTFFANISHEFRTPLSLIKGPIEDQLNLKTLPKTQHNNLLAAQRNTHRLESLIEQLLALSKLESGNIKLQVQPGHLSPFIAAQIEVFSYKSLDKKIKTEVHLPESTDVEWFDRDLFEKVISNLMGNAVKYTPEKGIITVTGKREDSIYKVSVKNSGAFLTQEQQNNIFQRFYQTDPKNPGTGIGLSLTKELIELHKGTVLVKSEENEYTEFIISIPIIKNTYTEAEILLEEVQKPKPETVSAQKTDSEAKVEHDENTPILLIVDDSEEIRDYVASVFEKEYVTIKAANGKEGFEMAKSEIPDIIISDVLMPIEDGLSLTKNVKKDPLTSHIPIILLTAKNKMVDKLEAMGLGADAYITKPFSSKLVKATAANLIETRRKLQQRFAQEVILTPKEMSISSADEQFLDRLQKVIDEHITNPDFTVDLFGTEMGVSRMQLHRKLKALTGYSTTEFLRNQRLKLAAQLLKTDKISVSEVGYTVGFNDISYFGKCFKKEFGCAPSEYTTK